MTYLRHYFAGRTFLASGPAAPFRYREVLGEPYSIAYFCRGCGDIHLRAPVEKDGVPLPWVCEPSLCEKCAHLASPILDFPGTFWRPARPEFNNLLPMEVLLHDFHAGIRHYERNNWL